MEIIALYFWLKLDAIIALSFGIFCMAAIAIFFSWLWSTLPLYDQQQQERRKALKKPWKKFAWVGICALVLSTVIPTKTQTAVLIGGHYALKLSDTPEANKVMTLLRKKANDLLDEELNK